MTTAPWRDPALPAAARVDDLLARMTLEEKTAQLYGVWAGAGTDGEGVAPHQHDMTSDHDGGELIVHGLGRLTRSFGTAPVDPDLGTRAPARAQRRITRAGRFGIPAVAHEECLAGFTAWQATAYATRPTSPSPAPSANSAPTGGWYAGRRCRTGCDGGTDTGAGARAGGRDRGGEGRCRPGPATPLAPTHSPHAQDAVSPSPPTRTATGAPPA
ncbi:hypothetical protein GCM10027162_70460 [Streptomyces incanus]